MNCPKCGKPMADNARFCGACGSAIGPVAVPIPRAVPEPSPMAAAIPVGASAPGGGFAPSRSAAAGIFERFKNILLSPKTEWPVIAAETASPTQITLGYLLPLTAVVALLSLIRVSFIGTSGPFGAVFRSPLSIGLETAALTFVASFISVWLVAFIVNGLAPTFGGTRDLNRAFKVAVYCLTPAYAASLLALSPILPTLLELLAVFYGIYVLYLGLPVLMRSTVDRAVGYTATVIVCTVLIGIVLEFVIGGLLLGTRGLGSGAGFMGNAATDPAQQGAAAAASVIGSALGTDDKGKAGLTAALTNLAKAGEQTAAQANAAASASAQPAATTDAAQAAAPAGADPSQNPAAAMGGVLTALGGAMGGDHPVAVADFKVLTAVLPPALPGLKRTQATGEAQGAIGIKTSSATGTYRNDSGASVQIEITDMSAVSGLMNMASAMAQSTTSQSDTGFEKDVVINGRTVHEKYDTPSKHGDMTVMLAKRYQVEVTGDGVDMGSLEQSFNQIDLARLEAMKDVGSPGK